MLVKISQCLFITEHQHCNDIENPAIKNVVTDWNVYVRVLAVLLGAQETMWRQEMGGKYKRRL